MAAATPSPSNPKFGEQEFTEEELAVMRKKLEEKIGAKHISYRKAHDGLQVPYLETNRAISFANEIFGYGGWASQVVNLQVDYIDETDAGKFNAGVSAIVRVQLKDGTHHEADNQRNKAQALEFAKKSAVSDGIKRALRCFGNALGNSMSDKDHLKNVKNNAPKAPLPSLNSFGGPSNPPTYNNNQYNPPNQQNSYPQQQNNANSAGSNPSSNTFSNRNFNDTQGGNSSASGSNPSGGKFSNNYYSNSTNYTPQNNPPQNTNAQNNNNNYTNNIPPNNTLSNPNFPLDHLNDTF